MKKVKLLELLAVSGLMMAGGCASETPAPVGEEPGGNQQATDFSQVQISEKARKAADGFNNFAFRMLDQAIKAESDPNANVVLSPMSMSMTMGMLANGADGATRSQILDAIGSAGLSLDELNASCSEILNGYTGLADSQVSIANSLWVDSSFPLNDSFRRDVASVFRGEARCMSPLASQAAVDEINQWVGRATCGLIPQLLEPGSMLQNFAVVNALYLKSQWSEKFASTETGDFANADGSTGKADFMRGVVQASLSKCEGMKVLTLSLSDGFCISVMLPEGSKSPASLISSLTSEKLIAAAADGNDLYEVSMPKLSLEFELGNGARLLSALGIKDLFGTKADLSRMTSAKGICLNAVLQKSKLNLDEKGIEAAAATIAGNFGISDSRPEYTKVNVNRPFAFVVWHKPTASIFFNGVVNHID